ncbi:hypothetical protein B0H14DRAFT_3098629 [Mycena olivaceomarginata]|nr:hypothetical protein B0H14DRAFT_3098629 [Mycena olivaceomarginata]
MEDSEYFPYPNKTVMLLDIMDNLPRCRFTSDHLSLILHFAKKLGVADVPSLKGFRKTQKQLQLASADAPVKSKSHLGNVFYMNDIRETIARDMANPLVAPHMQFYPEETNGPVSETYQAERWMEYTPSELTPMYSRGGKRFWIEELAQLANGRYVIPHTWIVRNGAGAGSFTERRRRQSKQTSWSWIGTTFEAILENNVPAMPNPMRLLVNDDEELYVVMVSPWADDQYNKHMNMCAGNGCLPGRLLQQEYHQFSTFRDHVKSTEKSPVKCFNAVTKRNSRFILRTPGLTGDNPQQSDEASHMGGNANFPCRKCHWGGTRKEKEGDINYHTCHLVGIARNAAEIRETLDKQLQHAMRGDAKMVENLQRETGTKDKITQYWIERLLARAKDLKAERRTRTPTEIAAELQKWNPLLDLPGLDPSQDTPVELLHTVLLGVMKYIWHFLNTNQWSDADRHLLAIRLQSTDITGLTIPPLRAGYMIQYRNNLIGKHFKSLMQILVFHAHKICTPEQFRLIQTAGDLGARLWVPEIDNMDQYLAQLKIAIANLLDAFDVVDPLRILVKIKLHLLAHIPDDIRRFGPAIRFATEIYEAYNGVFRLCSIYSNHLAPSRDISLKFASMSRVKHYLSGGYWRSLTSLKWIQAGGAVAKVFQRHLGWVPPADITPAFVKTLTGKKKGSILWKDTTASRHWQQNIHPTPDSGRWELGQYVIAKSGDRASTGSWVFALHSGKTIIGRIKELLVNNALAMVTLEQFMISSQRHPEFLWPGKRSRRDGVQSFLALDATSIQFLCSVQHDCRRGDCQPSAVQKAVQEREETDRDICLIKHNDDDHFILNLGGFHNFVRICRVLLPASLTDLKPLIEDRVAFHKTASSTAQRARKNQRKRTAARRRETAQTKKREAELAVGGSRTCGGRSRRSRRHGGRWESTRE